MFGLLQNWIGRVVNPIGIDLGSDCVRMAQVQWSQDQYKMIAAGSAEVPASEIESSADIFADAIRDLRRRSDFRGRHAVLALPAAMTGVRIVNLDRAVADNKLADAVRETLRYERVDVDRCLIRSSVANDEETRAIAVLADRGESERLIAAVESTGLELVGMTIEPQAIVDCFAHVYRRRTDADVTNAFVDIGFAGTRMVIAKGQQLLSVSHSLMGGRALCEAAAGDESIAFDAARQKRIRNARTVGRTLRDGTQLIGPASTERTPDSIGPKQNAAIEALIGDIGRARDEHDARCEECRVDRMIFVGGEARQTRMCDRIAMSVGIAAQIGDPLIRMGRTTDVGVESGIDRRESQPAWTVALGLTLGSSLPPISQLRHANRNDRTLNEFVSVK